MYRYQEWEHGAPLPTSDLACERRQIDAGLSGVHFQEERVGRMRWERLTVESAEGEKSIGRPRGQYDTLTLPRMDTLTEEQADDAAEEVARELCQLCERAHIQPERILVVGLGNGELTPDAIGPRAAARVHATMHIHELDRATFCALECSEIAVTAPGVMAESGMEAAETVMGLCDRIAPDVVLAIDALASRSPTRLGCTVQISDTGIFPGSGIGNTLAPLNEQTLGVPVIAIGVPTVIDSRLFLMEGAADLPPAIVSQIEEKCRQEKIPMFVSPREINGITESAANVIARGINQAFGIL